MVLKYLARLPRKKILLLLILFVFLINILQTYFLNIIDSLLQPSVDKLYCDNESKEIIDSDDEFQYITALENCGGIANKMWVYASLWSIGQTVDRIAAYPHNSCMKKDLPEIRELFPEFYCRIKFLPMPYPNNSYHLLGFARHCCQYDDPKRIAFKKLKKYVRLNNMHLQHHKFLEGRRHEIRKIFKCSVKLKTAVQNVTDTLLGDNKDSHRLCVHTRRGDFVRDDVASSKEFTEKGIHYAYKALAKKHGKISVVLMGEAKDFLANLTFDKMLIPNVYITPSLSRGEDLCFGMNQCDSLLITAQASSFAWWIAYLLPEAAPVYFNADFNWHSSWCCNRTFSLHNFLPEWIPIYLDRKTKKIEEIPRVSFKKNPFFTK